MAESNEAAVALLAWHRGHPHQEAFANEHLQRQFQQLELDEGYKQLIAAGLVEETKRLVTLANKAIRPSHVLTERGKTAAPVRKD